MTYLVVQVVRPSKALEAKEVDQEEQVVRHLPLGLVA